MPDAHVGLAPGDQQPARTGPGSAPAMTSPGIIASLDPYPSETTAATPPTGIRLRLRDPGVAGGSVAGGWWPRTVDLTVELPPLLAEMYSAGYDIRSVTYNPAAWDRPPRRLRVPGHQVRLGGYRTQDTALISLVDTSGWQRVDLVVIPPETDEILAGRALALAGLDGDLHRAGQILQQARRQAPVRVVHTECVDLMPSADWETDGGRIRAS
jgi:hypothetical protein